MNNQIEEMATTMQKCYEKNGLLNFKWFAEALYNAGYRKIPKDNVVLSREEQERILTATEKRIKELKKQILQARKETAEKILNEFLDFVNGWFEGVENNDFCVELNRISKDLAKQYGVEIKENNKERSRKGTHSSNRNSFKRNQKL